LAYVSSQIRKTNTKDNYALLEDNPFV